jgi:tripartite-type tricarboxylate transporter receptor subunit TctC
MRALLFLLLFAVTLAHAQEYPSRPIRVILPQSPGSATDVLGRLVVPKLGEALGQPLVIDNRVGAGGLVGADAAAKSAPDGYTLLIGATAWITVVPHTQKNMPYDALSDFVPVSLFAVSQNLLVVNPSLATASVKELVALMKAKPDQLNMASAGIASSSHLAGLLLTSLAGVRALHVPYKGAGGSVLAVVSGEAHWTFTPMQGPLGQVRAGKLRPLAVGGSSRSPALPDVPTVAEAGIPEYFSGTWYGFMVPKGTPRDIVERLNAATRTTMEGGQMREQILNQGAEAKTNTPAEFAAFVRDEYERMGKVVKLAGLVAE